MIAPPKRFSFPIHCKLNSKNRVFQPIALVSNCKSKEDKKDQESIHSSTTLNPGHHLEKWHKHQKTSHTREPRGQPFPSRWPQGCKEQIRQYGRQTQNTNYKRFHKRNTALEQSVRKVLKGWNMFDGTNIIHPYFWCASRQIDVWFALKIPYWSMYHLLADNSRAEPTTFFMKKKSINFIWSFYGQSCVETARGPYIYSECIRCKNLWQQKLESQCWSNASIFIYISSLFVSSLQYCIYFPISINIRLFFVLNLSFLYEKYRKIENYFLEHYTHPKAQLFLCR